MASQTYPTFAAARSNIGSLNASDTILIVRGGVTYKTTPADIKTYLNPMTTQDDIIIGGASGALTRLAKGSDGQVLTVDPTTHHLVWATPSGGGGGYTQNAQSKLGSAQSIPDTTQTVASFDTENYDTDSMVDIGGNPTRITIQTDGKYFIEFVGYFASNSTGYRYAAIYEGGSILIGLDSKQAVNGTITGVNPHATLSLVAGNYLEIKVAQTSGGSLNLVGAFSVTRVG
jgi:hypothetical protein